MNKYRIIKQLGDGSFGTVMEGEHQETREKVGDYVTSLPLKR
jgi:serine/threonine protein kinase